jgi:hypothetical protein
MAEQIDAQEQRKKMIDARNEWLRERMPKREPVRVVPQDETTRKLLKHPSGIRFPPSGSVEWPLDRFTRRRLADGSVTREGDKAGGKPPPGPAPHRAAHQ